ncbi:hypothetical protein O0L34_g12088 [Tuta absoluta]|nr:hypothetical protein O0L34_g12088 [Tuta absoluta]
MFSICTVVIGIILSFVPWLDYLIFRELKLWNGSLSYSYWHKPGVHRYTKVYIFNVTNPQGFLEHGEKPKLVEVGPFVYREDMEKVNIKFHDNDTVSYQHNKILRFMPDMSVDKNQKLVVPNIPLLTVTSSLASSSIFSSFSLLSSGLVSYLQMTDKDKAKPFVHITAEELVFGYDDQLVHLASIFYPKGKRPNKQMGLLLARNGTLEEVSTIYTGQKTMDRFGYLDKVDGMDHLRHWKHRPCNDIRASEGSFFPPRETTGEDIVHIYDKDLCRILPLQYRHDVYKDGIKTGMYTPPEATFESADKNDDNKCYCENEKCAPKGLQNISPCQYFAPVFLSFPHFLDADPELLTPFEGLKPVREKHQTYFMIQPKIGVPLEGFVRVQLNLRVTRAPNVRVNNIHHFPDTMFPVMWLEEGIHEVTPSIWRWIYCGTTVAPILGPVLTYGMIAFGLSIMAYIFVKSYKSFVIGQNSIEIVEIGRETIRRGSTLIINGTHKIIPTKEQSYQPLNQGEGGESPQVEDKEFNFIKRQELSQSLDELKGRFDNNFVKSDFDFNETDRESLIHSDNSFILSERRCSMLNLRDFNN